MKFFTLYGGINVSTVITVAQSGQHVPVHMLKDANATRKCTLNDAIVKVKPYTQ